MIQTIAINKDETLQLEKSGGLYSLRKKTYVWNFWIWEDVKSTCEEWLAVKWILDYELTVAGDYPTLDDIREEQREEK